MFGRNLASRSSGELNSSGLGIVKTLTSISIRFTSSALRRESGIAGRRQPPG